MAKKFVRVFLYAGMGNPNEFFGQFKRVRAHVCVCVCILGVLQASFCFTGAHTSNPGPCGEGGADVDLTEAAALEPF